tara:strand:+ start:733 stop:1050 length:318 start_codon:yes stop_codon:yes gene_type:complete
MAEENKTPEAATEETAAPTSGPVPTPGVDQNAPAAGDPAAPDLNISDLNAVKSIIEVATQRGAFKATELEAVGKAFNKLTAFLDHVVKQQQAAAPAAPEGGTNNG